MSVPRAKLRAVLENRLTWLFHHAHAAHRGAVREGLLDDIGVTLTQYLALAELENCPNRTTSDLAFACSVTRQSMHRTVTALTQAGYIEREPAYMDGRSIVNRVTPEGREVLARADVVVRRVEYVVLQGLDELERDELARLLRECARVIEASFGRRTVAAWGF
jgi:DNA-binding MarR family transcriptional regulator